MAHLAACALVWALTFLLVPVRRIAALWRAVAISLVWMILVDNLMAGLGYYAFEGNWLPVGRVSAFQLLVYAGAGVLMVNWLNEGPISKLVAVLAVAMVSSLLGFFYSRAGAFRLMRLDPVAHFVYYVAALSVYLWLALAFVGERTIYSGERTRRFILSD